MDRGKLQPTTSTTVSQRLRPDTIYTIPRNGEWSPAALGGVQVQGVRENGMSRGQEANKTEVHFVCVRVRVGLCLFCCCFAFMMV